MTHPLFDDEGRLVLYERALKLIQDGESCLICPALSCALTESQAVAFWKDYLPEFQARKKELGIDHNGLWYEYGTTYRKQDLRNWIAHLKAQPSHLFRAVDRLELYRMAIDLLKTNREKYICDALAALLTPQQRSIQGPFKQLPEFQEAYKRIAPAGNFWWPIGHKDERLTELRKWIDQVQLYISQIYPQGEKSQVA